MQISAQEYDVQAPISPELIAHAQTGDAYANYVIAYKYFLLDDAKSLKQALQHLTVAKEGYLAAGEDGISGLMGIQKMIGDVHTELFEFAMAIKMYAIAIETATRANDMLNKGLNEHALGMALQGLSRYEEAITYIERARTTFSTFQGSESTYIADTYLSEGISYEGLKLFDQALAAYGEVYKRYVAIQGPNSVVVAYAINNIAWVFRRMGNFDQSYDWFSRALPIIDHHEGQFSINAGKVRINLGIVEYQRGNSDEAIRWTMRAMPFIRANKETTLSDQRWAFDTLARAFRAKNDPNRAIVFAKLSVNAHQSIRKKNSELAASETKALSNEWRWIYQHLADLLIEQGRISEAQAVLNMEKEQEVFEFLRRDGGAAIRNTQSLLNDAELSEQEKVEAIAKMPIQAARELTSLMAKLDRGEATSEDEDRIFLLQESVQIAVDQFEEDLEAFLENLDLAESDSLKEQMKAVGAYQTVLEGFEQKAAILQIASIADATHLFLTLPQITIHEKINISKADLSRLVFNALQAIEARAPDVNEHLQALHAVLLAPISDALKESKTEIIMLNLDGFLRYIPFAALFDGESYAVEKYAFALYSTVVPTQFVRSDRRSTKTVGFGVTAAHPGFSALPGVRKELETIFVGDDATGVLNGKTELDEAFDQRNLKRALLRKPEILHIASHFNLVPGREDDSFLLLGDGEHLLLSDIRRKKALSFRGIDLLTLSACQTARGSGDGSEIEGFAATAQLNGASSVMASLWPVSDEATPQLMRQFYHNMVTEGLSKAGALRSAQIEMLHGNDIVASLEDRGAIALNEAPSATEKVTFAHPYFWSAFILMGNWL